MRLRRLFLFSGAAAALAAGGYVTVANATTGSGTTTTILAHRAALADRVQVNQDKVKFQTLDPTDVLVQTITFAPHAFTGWHIHPGVVIVVVESGHVTTHNGSCQTTVYGPHQAFVESGTEPFEVTNDSSTANAVVYATLVVGSGDPFRIDTNPPACAS